MGDLTDELAQSPCTGVCTLNADDRCVGCGRTLDDIARWATMSASERQVVMAGLRDAVPGVAKL